MIYTHLSFKVMSDLWNYAFRLMVRYITISNWEKSSSRISSELAVIAKWLPILYVIGTYLNNFNFCLMDYLLLVAMIWVLLFSIIF